jgi:hypothetical protein
VACGEVRFVVWLKRVRRTVCVGQRRRDVLDEKGTAKSMVWGLIGLGRRIPFFVEMGAVTLLDSGGLFEAFYLD